MSFLEELRKFDKKDMISDVLDFPEMCKKAYEPIINDLGADFDKIAVVGMGGSGIGGDMTKAFLRNKCSIPVLINKDYWLPKTVDEDTLLFVISYSGNTAETLSSLREGVDRGCGVVAVSSDGEISRLSKEIGFPLFEVRKGIQPRAAFPYLFLPIISTLKEIGYIEIDGFEETINNLVVVREKNKPSVDLEKNDARKLANKLKKGIPVIYSYGKFSPVAYRWKCQLNENSKMFSIWNKFPELTHNEVVGWSHELTDLFNPVIIKEKNPSNLIKEKINAAGEVIDREINYFEVIGDSLLSKYLTGVFFGDLVSVYLAILNKVDPTPVREIDKIKNQLSE